MTEASEDQLATIREYDERIRKTFETGSRKGKLKDIGGHFSIVVYEHAVWTVISDGPRAGVYAEVTDDDMAFIMITTPDVFSIMHSQSDADIDAFDLDGALENKRIAMHGDPEVYLRFVALGQADDMISLRSGGTGAGASLRAKKLKKRRGAV